MVCQLPNTAEDVQVVAVVERAHARRITPRRPVWQPGRVQDSVFQKQEAEELGWDCADGNCVSQHAASAVEGRAFVEPTRRGQIRGGLELVSAAQCGGPLERHGSAGGGRQLEHGRDGRHRETILVGEEEIHGVHFRPAELTVIEMIGIWFFARPLVLDAARVKENRFPVSFIALPHTRQGKSLQQDNCGIFLAVLA